MGASTGVPAREPLTPKHVEHSLLSASCSASLSRALFPLPRSFHGATGVGMTQSQGQADGTTEGPDAHDLFGKWGRVPTFPARMLTWS